MTMRIVGATLFLITAAAAAAAQERWSVGIEVATARYGGTSLDTTATGEASGFRPHNPAVVSLWLGRRTGPVRLSLALSRGKADIGIGGRGVLLVSDDLGTTCYRLSPQAAVPLGRTAHEGTLWLSLGPALEVWQVSLPAEIRTRLGGAGAIWFEQRLTRAVAGTVRVSGTLAPSFFQPNELPPDFTRRATWSLALGVGVTLQR